MPIVYAQCNMFLLIKTAFIGLVLGFLAVLEFEFKASPLVGKHSTT
jgi:hypothetical protein